MQICRQRKFGEVVHADMGSPGRKKTSISEMNEFSKQM
jgi:hypothetical protein